MATGKSPILVILEKASKLTTAPIEVVLSQRFYDPDVYESAGRIFTKRRLDLTKDKCGVLIYINTRKKKFSILADSGFYQKVGSKYFEGLAKNLKDDLLSTHFENAVALNILTLAATLNHHFPT